MLALSSSSILPYLRGIRADLSPSRPVECSSCSSFHVPLNPPSSVTLSCIQASSNKRDRRLQEEVGRTTMKGLIQMGHNPLHIPSPMLPDLTRNLILSHAPLT